MKPVTLKKTTSHGRGRDGLNVRRDRRERDLVAAKDSVSEERRVRLLGAHDIQPREADSATRAVELGSYANRAPVSSAAALSTPITSRQKRFRSAVGTGSGTGAARS